MKSALNFAGDETVLILNCWRVKKFDQSNDIIIGNFSFGRLGAHYRKGNEGYEQDFEVERIINHHSYKRPYGMAHDISLLKLRRPAQINRHVKLACLPDSSGGDLDGKMCWVTGNKYEWQWQ